MAGGLTQTTSRDDVISTPQSVFLVFNLGAVFSTRLCGSRPGNVMNFGTIKLVCVSLLLGGSGLLWVASSNAQEFDELFERSTDSRFGFSAEDEPFGADDGRLNRTTARDSDSVEPNRRSTKSPKLTPRPSGSVRSPSDLKFVDQSGSISERRHATAMQIRQARALQESRSRLARLEAARWAGAPALRPSWNPDPMTSSRYPNRRVVQVPIYIRGR